MVFPFLHHPVESRGVCSGIWDLPCFVEHLCVSSLARLFVVAILTYIGESITHNPDR
jgi:hypothetical protein